MASEDRGHQQQQLHRQLQQEGQEEGAGGPTVAKVEWPGDGAVTDAWMDTLAASLDAASRRLPPSQLPSVLSASVAESLIMCASRLLHREPNCLRVAAQDAEDSVVLVGDLHGQFHDLLHLLQLAGPPSASRIFVFNGDYVDRGAWGIETFLLLLAWKVFLPHRVFLLRGNHETRFCTSAYGFEQEVMAKYGDMGKHLYRKLLGCFEGLPLAAIIADSVYMAHGGLFRHVSAIQKKKGKKGKARKMPRNLDGAVLRLGSLEELATARRGVLDPSGLGGAAIPGDVLWSDPAVEQGLSPNVVRGVGLLWGPDCTEEFLRTNRLKLIVRSHEGPDARVKRADMKNMDKGYTIDHVVESGKLITLFSAPDYPQFQASNLRYKNKGAYIVLESPDYSSPLFFTFNAVLPRPKVTAYYDFVNAMDSDEELDLGTCSDVSSASEGET